jgi:GT2 family glycosyltransferase
MKMPRAAIVIPAFEAAGTIAATLRSVQAQGCGLAELSAVYMADDGSRDPTVSVAGEAWRFASPPLRVLSADRNLGQWPNVNRALGALPANVEWVLLLHADDLAKSGWLDAMLGRMNVCEPDVASICSSWEALLPDGTVAGGEDDPRQPVHVVRGTSQAVRDTVVSGCWWHISGCAMRLRAFRDVGPFNPALAFADWEWLLRCLARGWQVEYVPTTLIQYRQHAGSVSADSFQRDQDIYETLAVVQRYARLLTLRDVWGVHFREGQFAGRRFGRAVLRGQPSRALARGRTLAAVVTSLSRYLLDTARTTAGRPT